LADVAEPIKLQAVNAQVTQPRAAAMPTPASGGLRSLQWP
jgi:hypothetical protein